MFFLRKIKLLVQITWYDQVTHSMYSFYITPNLPRALLKGAVSSCCCCCFFPSRFLMAGRGLQIFSTFWDNTRLRGNYKFYHMGEGELEKKSTETKRIP